jgi:AI-2E family transporter
VWVALVDFLPMVGGALAGIPTVLFALAHSLTAGIITAAVFVGYQQLENHVLNPLIMSKTVKVSPLLVLLSVLLGTSLGDWAGGVFGGFVAALISIPCAAAWSVPSPRVCRRPPSVAPRRMLMADTKRTLAWTVQPEAFRRQLEANVTGQLSRPPQRLSAAVTTSQLRVRVPTWRNLTPQRNCPARAQGHQPGRTHRDPGRPREHDASGREPERNKDPAWQAGIAGHEPRTVRP